MWQALAKPTSLAKYHVILSKLWKRHFVVNFEVEVMCNVLNQTVFYCAVYAMCDSKPVTILFVFWTRCRWTKLIGCGRATAVKNVKYIRSSGTQMVIGCLACDRLTYIALCWWRTKKWVLAWTCTFNVCRCSATCTSICMHLVSLQQGICVLQVTVISHVLPLCILRFCL
jgi:hypothetical protein